ncbi:hypothetical protein TNCT_304991 [Trichonephila clavata]|uniref:Uncharacterized protein n=1 Tax=Trichonephila clavata TaxID=2740835 RepID=A0A8X6HI08_TRICU|nr:hypothetical protein TNCT_304991 [Trichonephila clavata]
MRDVSLNSQCIILFKNNPDVGQMQCFTRQVYEHKAASFMDADKKSTQVRWILIARKTKENLRDTDLNDIKNSFAEDLTDNKETDSSQREPGSYAKTERRGTALFRSSTEGVETHLSPNYPLFLAEGRLNTRIYDDSSFLPREIKSS